MHFTITPTWFLRMVKKGRELSDWIDDALFPVPAAHTGAVLTRQQVQLMAERDADKIRKRIAACRSLEQAYSIRPVLDKYREMYGNTPQVKAAEGSLRLELFHKENEIIEAI